MRLNQQIYITYSIAYHILHTFNDTNIRSSLTRAVSYAVNSAPFIYFAIYEVVCVQLTHLSLNDREDIF